MVKPLTFKGDKPRKRKNTSSSNSTLTKTPKTTSEEFSAGAHDDNTAEDQSWVSADLASDISGPVVLVLPTEQPSCIASDANGTVFASALENLIDNDPSTAEPHDVRQVWVVTKVAGSDSISFKGYHGKYVFSFLL